MSLSSIRQWSVLIRVAFLLLLGTLQIRVAFLLLLGTLQELFCDTSKAISSSMDEQITWSNN